MTAVTVGVLALQGDVREHARVLRACGADVVAVRRPGELAAVDGLVLPGGESTTIDKLLRRFGLRDPLRERIAQGFPVFGSCAGMILLADRLLDAPADQETVGGIDVLVRRNAFGRQVDSFEQELHAPGLGVRPGQPPMTAVFIRAPWVEEAGPDVEVLATVSTGPATGTIVAVRQGALMATAFHPEISSDTRVHEVFVASVEASVHATRA